MCDELPAAPEVSRATTTAQAEKKAAIIIKTALYKRIGRLACIVFEVSEHKNDCAWWWPLHNDDPTCCSGAGFGGLLALFNRLVAGGVTKQQFTEAVHATKPTLGEFSRATNYPKKLYYSAPRRTDESDESEPAPYVMPYHDKSWSAEELPIPFISMSLRDLSKSYVVADVRAKLEVSSRQ
jgi:hypothetical protein